MKYSTKEIAKILQVSDRTVRRHLQNLIAYTDKGFEVDESVVEILKKKHSSDSHRTTSGQAPDTEETNQESQIVEYFSNEQYEMLEEVIHKYPILLKELELQKERIEDLKKDKENHKNELEYHRVAAQKHLNQIDKILTLIKERNLIEAADKKYLNTPPRDPN